MGKWKREKIGEIKEPIEDYIRKLVKAEYEKGNHIKIVIGTDSQKRGKGFNFSTVILLEIKSIWEDRNDIVIEVGRGAMALYRNTYIDRRFQLKEKMIKEVELTVELTYELTPLFDELKCSVELHADINSNVKASSNVALETATGWMSGTGFKWKFKPDAYVATHTADKYCR